MTHPLDWLDAALADLDRRELRRSLRQRQSPQRGDRIVVDGQELVNFGSNDYLGLAADPRVLAAVSGALASEGFGAGASPLVTGRSELHARLEGALAEWLHAEAALLFSSGYAANVGAITALVGRGDALYSDQLNHASIIDGCRLSGADVHVFPNDFTAPQRQQDLSRLQELLQQGGAYRRKLIVTDAVFSMHGTYAPLAALAELASEFNAMLMVDEAHALGVLGDQGRGLCAVLPGGARADVRVGTLSKALGGHGGFVAGSQRLIDWLANRARPYVFSTAAPAALAAGAVEAIRIVRTEPERRQTLAARSSELRQRLVERGLIPATTLAHIVPVLLGDAGAALAATAELRRRGLFVPGIRPPSVPPGQSLLRISLTCLHTEQQITDLAAALADVCH